MYPDIEQNYKTIIANFGSAMSNCGRSDKVRLLAVTKTVDTDRINYAASLGATLIGENKVQELLDKYDKLDPSIEVHFIGHLQTNKVKYITDKVSMIHSVDSYRLAEEISRQCIKLGRSMDILIQVNVGEEATKSGVPPLQTRALLDEIKALPNINVRGLMAIPPISVEKSTTREYFCTMQKIFIDIFGEKSDNENNIYQLSMGMSGDYTDAINFGSTIVRIGSALFGGRVYNNL
ncbi:MAG: YggS family pyridoxal phosphate-dependent enzyme [Eubacteriales bacterium]